jgi:hypothetical protein
MRPRSFGLFFASLLLAVPALASPSDSGEIFTLGSWTIPGTVAVEGATVEPRSQRAWKVTFDRPALLDSAAAHDPATVEQRPQAFTYSDAYNTRRKIHMAASWATIPLFVGQYIAGQKLYDGQGSDSAKSWHGALAGGVAALFAVNSVTGVWNLWEARQDPNGKSRRLIHGLLMLGADAGFVATGLMAPGDDGDGGSSKSAHRTVAITSMGVAAGSYLYMLVTR